MPYQSLVYTGFQKLSSLSTATPLTLPVGAQEAEGTACNLNGNLLTVGGTVTGVFAVGQIVQGIGVPANTYITAPQGLAPNPTSWWLSQACTTETGETVTAYADPGTNVAIFAVETEGVRFLPGGGTPTATNGFPLAAGAAPFVYDMGDLAALSFIQQSASAVLDVLYYRAVAIG